MGRAKEEMFRQYELGYAESGMIACAKCVGDMKLADVLLENPAELPCDFCGSDSETNGHFDAVLDQIGTALSLDYSSPEEVLPRDRESETGWFGDVLTISEVLYDIGYEAPNWEIMEEIFSAFSDRHFSASDFGKLSPNQRRFSGWKSFKNAVQHERRFSFWSMGDRHNDPDHPDYFAIGSVLDELSSIVNDADLTLQILTNQGYWRVRIGNADSDYRLAHELCPPPSKIAFRPNRMSPSGISMFYGAEELNTAIAETLDTDTALGKRIYAGKFTTEKQLNLLDLARIPSPPSYFDTENRNAWLALNFLRWFAEDLAKPVKRDGREQIDYIPTQVFTEYVRFKMRTLSGSGFDGIRYSSSKNKLPCVVLFCGHDECIDSTEMHVERWLKLDPDSVKQFDASDFIETSP